MKKLAKVVPYLVIIGLIIFILDLKGCLGKKKEGDTIDIGGKKYQVVKHEIDTFYEVKTQTIYRKGKDITHEVEVVKEIPSVVDTGAILKDYYSRVFYKDTFKLKDTLGYMVINDTISKNRIVSRKVNSFINVPTIKETLYLKEIANNWFIGPSIQLGLPLSLGADLHLKNKKDVMFGLGAGIYSNTSPYLRGSISWKLK